MADAIKTEVVKAIADAKGVEPVDLDYTVGEYIDLEAIEQLAAHDTASWTLSFKLPNHNVTVTSDGLILVDGVREQVWA
jgi:hypothetical protein